MIELFPAREVALRLGEWDVRWYGVLYVVAFGLAWWLLPRLQRYRGLKLTRDQWTFILTSALAGVLFGGRLGYVLLYEPAYFLQHPLHIFFIWEGGMASHGGIIGVAVALWLAARQLRINVWALADSVVVPAAVGLALGRIGNFINQELYGTPTTLPWGITVPDSSGYYHPVQLYEAAANSLVAVLGYYLLTRGRRIVPGSTFALFIVFYGSLRLVISYWRLPDRIVGQVGPLTVSLSQVLTIVLVISGLVLLKYLTVTEKHVR